MSKEYTGERFIPEECTGEIAIEHFQRYQFAKQLVKGKIVLDAACGEGYGSSLLSQDAEKVVGLDLDKETVVKATEKYGNNKVSFLTGSIEKLPFDDYCFDVVVSYETIEHVASEAQCTFLREIRRVLKPDGILIISTPNKAVYTDLVKGDNSYHIKEFYPGEFQSFLTRYFGTIEIFCQYPDLGYFLSRQKENIHLYSKKGKSQEECRYIIAVCCENSNNYKINTTGLTMFDDSMYYELNRYVHQAERDIIKLKTESESFSNKLEKSIKEQKEYISRLENDISLQKKYIEKLEKDNQALREARERLIMQFKHPFKCLRERIERK